MKWKTMGALALSMAAAAALITGCGSESVNEGVTTVSPYQRVAVLDGNWTAVEGIADRIALYVTMVDESAAPHSFPSNWVIAGANPASSETYEYNKDLLKIPGMDLSIAETGKSRIIEFCNGAYATAATNTGRFHGSALPCEVSVHSDGSKVYIDMLDAEGIFGLLFADVDDTSGDMAAMAAAVKSELREMILAALDDSTVVTDAAALADPNVATAPVLPAGAIAYTEKTTAMGPKFTQADIAEKVATRNPYVVYKYSNGGAPLSLSVDANGVATKIISTMGGTAGFASALVPGLSAGSKWKSGREAPLAIPGVKVVEACSEKYAPKATMLGNEYLTALPCEITVYVDEANSSKLGVSFLSPSFMFNTLFEGAVETAYANGEINASQVVEYSTLAEVVYADLRMIVDKAITDYNTANGTAFAPVE